MGWGLQPPSPIPKSYISVTVEMSMALKANLTHLTIFFSNSLLFEKNKKSFSTMVPTSLSCLLPWLHCSPLSLDVTFTTLITHSPFQSLLCKSLVLMVKCNNWLQCNGKSQWLKLMQHLI